MKEQASEMIYVENVLNSDSMKKKMIEYPEEGSHFIIYISLITLLSISNSGFK